MPDKEIILEKIIAMLDKLPIREGVELYAKIGDHLGKKVDSVITEHEKFGKFINRMEKEN